MIPEGRFGAQLEAIEKLLGTLELLEERQASPNKLLGAAHFRGMTYRQVYEECVREYAYDFRLVDQALLLFTHAGHNKDDGQLGFCYYESPVNVVAYRDFVALEFGISPIHPHFPKIFAEFGDGLRPDYEQYVTSQDSKAVVTPLRFDYRAEDYRPGIHPAAHLHFGYANQIRVGTRRVMNPLSFFLFILRQRYPEKWLQFRTLKDFEHLSHNVRRKLDLVHEDYWRAEDEHEASLQ
jgi:hypothetical protein